DLGVGLRSRLESKFLIGVSSLQPYQVGGIEDQLIDVYPGVSAARQLKEVAEGHNVAGLNSRNVSGIEESDLLGIVLHEKPGQFFIVGNVDASINLREANANRFFHPRFCNLFVDACVLNLYGVLQRISDAIVQIKRHGIVLSAELND